MKTYQDLLECKTEEDRARFIEEAIADHKGSDEYLIAADAVEYERQRNVTISRYRKILYDLRGNAVPDNWTANHKCASNFFRRFTTQEAAYLLGNGVTFEKEGVKEKLGKNIDTVLYKVGKTALVQGVAYGFYNLDHVDVFGCLEFVPLYDEESGALKAGVRHWQISSSKPLRATLYEMDGYTDYIKREGKNMEIMSPKRSYILNVIKSGVDNEETRVGANYSKFPIVPLWGNLQHQSELVGMRENIDCYDLIKSGFANDLDDASAIYWTLTNSGGMDDVSLAQFVERMKTVKAAVIGDENGEQPRAEAHTVEVPYQSREAYLTRLENDMYNDYMALNVAQISAGNVTATQIEAAYEPLDNKADEFEFCVIDFLSAILAISGLEDKPTFKRSRIVNRTEETQMILSAADQLDDETILRKLPFLTEDEIDGIMARRDAESAARYDSGDDGAGGGEGGAGTVTEGVAGFR